MADYGNQKQAASAALEDGGNPGDGADTPEKESSDNCFYLPSDFPGAENLKAGDTLTLRVRGKDAHGDIEVEHVADGGMGDGQDKPMMQDFDESMK